jgi:F-type H+-transporting ATPase subunit gamma
MSDSLESLRRQLNAAGELKSVVRAMKALAASSLGQYERAVLSLADYDQTVQLALKVGLRSPAAQSLLQAVPRANPQVRLVIFGSDQGLVGQFNEVIADEMESQFKPADHPLIWAVGERLADVLTDRGFDDVKCFALPHSVQAIASLIAHLLESLMDSNLDMATLDLRLFHHHPEHGAQYVPSARQLFPFDRQWSNRISTIKWPTNQLPEIVGSALFSFEALLREDIFISLYRACAESLASENASRLIAMQRAEKNIDELSGTLTCRFHQHRQSSIDEELFDVVAGFEALATARGRLA